MAENVIEVLIVGVDKLSPEAQRAIGTLKGLSGATSAVTGETVKATTATARFHGGLSPLRSLLIQTTGATGGLGAAVFNLIRFGLTPVGIAITAVVAAIGALTSAWRSASKASEEFEKSSEDLRRELALINVEYRAQAGIITNLQANIAKAALSASAERVEAARNEVARIKSIREASILVGGPISETILGTFGASEQRLQIAQAAEQQAEIAHQARLTAIKRQGALDAAEAVKKEMLKALSETAFAFEEELAEDMDEAYSKVREIIRQGNIELEAEILKGLSQLTFAWEEELAEDVDETYSKIREIIKKDNEEIAKNAEETAADMAKSFTDRFIDLMEGEKPDVLGFFRNLGKTIVSELLQEFFKAQLIGPLKASMRAGEKIPSTATGFLGLGNFFKQLFGFAHGGILSGNFLPANTLRTFQTGGITAGPTVGVVGEREPELVAPVRSVLNAIRDRGSTTVVIQGDVIPRPGIKPQDVILIVADDMERGGKTARASINLQKRR